MDLLVYLQVFPYEPLDDKPSSKVNSFENYDNTKKIEFKYELMGS